MKKKIFHCTGVEKTTTIISDIWIKGGIPKGLVKPFCTSQMKKTDLQESAVIAQSRARTVLAVVIWRYSWICNIKSERKRVVIATEYEKPYGVMVWKTEISNRTWTEDNHNSSSFLGFILRGVRLVSLYGLANERRDPFPRKFPATGQILIFQ